MDYAPEWIVYLWKKLILNNEDISNRRLTVRSFSFFDGPERRKLLADNAQKSIDTINRAVIAGSLIDMSGSFASDRDCYYYHSPDALMRALVELTRKPACIEIVDILVNKNFLTTCHGKKPYAMGPDAESKIETGKELTLADLGVSIFDNYSNNLLFAYLSFEIKINKKNLQEKLDAYLDDFMANKFVAPKGTRYIDPEKQMSNILDAIGVLVKKYGKSMTTTADEIAQAGGWYLKDEHRYRFYETLFSLEKAGWIEVTVLRKEEVMITLKNRTSIDTGPNASIQDAKLYVIKEGDDFRYKGRSLKLSKKTDYYKVFCSLFALIGNGGEIEYSALGKEIQSRVPKAKRFSKERMQKFILTNLTDRSNGFIHYADIPGTEDNGKPLITVNRGTGIIFNNRAG